MGTSYGDFDFENLALRLGRDDESALAEILTGVGPVLTAQLKRRFGSLLNNEDIDDVLAETLYRLWQHRKDYKGGRGSFLHWCYLIARNLALDSVRNKHRRREYFASLWQEIHEPADPTNQTDADISEAALLALRKALAALPPDDRRILLASVHNNPSGWATRLAKVTGVHAATLRQRRFRALERLRKEMIRSDLSDN